MQNRPDSTSLHPATTNSRRRRRRRSEDNDDNHYHHGTTENDDIDGATQPKEVSLPMDYGPLVDDILCGKTKKAFNHDGNEMFRIMIGSHVEQYSSLSSRVERGKFILKIVNLIHQQGGRFLKKKEDHWVVLNQKHAREKVGHALRDTACQANKSTSSKHAAAVAVLTKVTGASESNDIANVETASIPPLPLPQQLPKQQQRKEKKPHVTMSRKPARGSKTTGLPLPLIPLPLLYDISQNETSDSVSSLLTSPQSTLVASLTQQHHQQQYQQHRQQYQQHQQLSLMDFLWDESNSLSPSDSSEDVQIEAMAEWGKTANGKDGVFLEETHRRKRQSIEQYRELEPTYDEMTVKYCASELETEADAEVAAPVELSSRLSREDDDESDAPTIDQIESGPELSQIGDVTEGIDW